MIGFDVEKFQSGAQAASGQRENIEKIADRLTEKGFTNVFLVGIGGTYAYQLQAGTFFKSWSSIPAFVENAAEFVQTENKLLTKDSLVVVMSASGNTKEIVEAVAYSKRRGATVIGFINEAGTPLAEASDYLITGCAFNRYVFFEGSLFQLNVFVLRLIHNAGEFPQYSKFISACGNIFQGLLDVRKQADAQAKAFADAYKDEPLHYLVASGNLWGGTYSFGMCVLEECQWIRTRTIHAAEFFHGTLEVIERNTSVLLFKGEDETRELTERVNRFVTKISDKVSVFDTKDYPLPGFEESLRGLAAPFIASAIFERISAHLEDQRKHPLEIRRYYRRFDY